MYARHRRRPLTVVPAPVPKHSFAPAMFVVIFIVWKLVKRTRWETKLTADVTSFVDDPEVRHAIQTRPVQSMFGRTS